MNGSLMLLRETSKFIDLFKSTEPIRSVQDPRIVRAKEALAFFQQWESMVWKSTQMEDEDKRRALLSEQCRHDFQCTIIGFEQMVYNRLKRFPDSSILPFLCNSDICENIFCQARSCCCGPTTHPNYHQYIHALTSILLSQGLLSTHGNAGNNSAVASPFKFHSNKPLRKYRSKKTK